MPYRGLTSARCWRRGRSSAESVAAGDVIAVIESMKMEIPVEAPRAGVVKEIRAQPGDVVKEGEAVAVLG